MSDKISKEEYQAEVKDVASKPNTNGEALFIEETVAHKWMKDPNCHRRILDLSNNSSAYFEHNTLDTTNALLEQEGVEGLLAAQARRAMRLDVIDEFEKQAQL